MPSRKKIVRLRPAAAVGKAYQLKVTLRRVRPPVWRRLLVSGDTTLLQLHAILQAAMGWENQHLFEFVIAGRSYMPDDADLPAGNRDLQKRLAQIIDPGSTRFTYFYDFGDGWEHQIAVEALLPAAQAGALPRCTGGRRACPPEDCGGAWGYSEKLAILGDPTHPEREDVAAWWPPGFDPERFDPGQPNARLSALAAGGWRELQPPPAAGEVCECGEVHDEEDELFESEEFAMGTRAGMLGALVAVLAARGIEAKGKQLDRIMACKGPEEALAWITRAATAELLEDVFPPRGGRKTR